MSIEIFDDVVWQMSLGERAAVEGVLSQVAPSLAIEIGSMEGACLRRMAAHGQEVHSFDLHPPSLKMPENVTLHTGDSHELLAPFLAELAEQGRNVELVIVDGDHTPEGVRQDLEDLLNSPALGRSVILVHDTANERVRRGVDAVHFAAWPKVSHVELDWIPGRLFASPDLRNELWYGLGLVLVDATRLAYAQGEVYESRYHELGSLLAEIRDLVVARDRVGEAPLSGADQVAQMRKEIAELVRSCAAAHLREEQMRTALTALQHRVAGAERALHNVTGSASWKMTEPLRSAKSRATRRFGR